MFHSSGFFRNIDCPYFTDGNCDRPYCHFNHNKSNEKALSTLNIQKDEVNYITAFAQAIKSVKDKKEGNESLGNSKSNFCEAYKPKSLHTNSDVPEYIPTPKILLNTKEIDEQPLLNIYDNLDPDLLQLTVKFLSNLPKDEIANLKGQFIDGNYRNLDANILKVLGEKVVTKLDNSEKFIGVQNVSSSDIQDLEYSSLFNKEISSDINNNNKKMEKTFIKVDDHTKKIIQAISTKSTFTQNVSTINTSELKQINHVNKLTPGLKGKTEHKVSKIVSKPDSREFIPHKTTNSQPFKPLELDLFSCVVRSDKSSKFMNTNHDSNNNKKFPSKTLKPIKKQVVEILSSDEADESMISVSEADDLFGSDEADEGEFLTKKRDLTKDRLTQLKDDILTAAAKRSRNSQSAGEDSGEGGTAVGETRKLLLRVEGENFVSRVEEGETSNCIKKKKIAFNDHQKEVNVLEHDVSLTRNKLATVRKDLDKRLRKEDISIISSSAFSPKNPNYAMLKRRTSSNSNPAQIPSSAETSLKKGSHKRIAHVPQPISTTTTLNQHKLPSTEGSKSQNRSNVALSSAAMKSIEAINIVDADKYLDPINICPPTDSKLSLALRQKYLTLLWSEIIVTFTKIKTSLNQSTKATADDRHVIERLKGRAFESEFEAHSKCRSNKTIYFNLVARSVKQIRTATEISRLLSSPRHSDQGGGGGHFKRLIGGESSKTTIFNRTTTVDYYQQELLLARVLRTSYLVCRSEMIRNGYPYLNNTLLPETHSVDSTDGRRSGCLSNDNRRDSKTPKTSEKMATFVFAKVELVKRKCIDTFADDSEIIKTPGNATLDRNNSNIFRETSTTCLNNSPTWTVFPKISIHKDPPPSSSILRNVNGLTEKDAAFTTLISNKLPEKLRETNVLTYENYDPEALITHRFICCRCGKEYEILEQRIPKCRSLFTYVKGDEECIYHWGRLRRQSRFSNKKNAGPLISKYSCCGGFGQEPGCSLAKNHVRDKATTLYTGTFSRLPTNSASARQIYKYLTPEHPLKCWKTTTLLPSKLLKKSGIIPCLSGSSSILTTDISSYNASKFGQINGKENSESIGIPHNNNQLHLVGDISCSSGYNNNNNNNPSKIIITEDATELRVFGLDCEMVYTPLGNEIARVTVVGFNTATNRELSRKFSVPTTTTTTTFTTSEEFISVYDCFVRPRNLPVIDCNTRFSGIQFSDLETCDFDDNPTARNNRPLKSFLDVQADIISLLQNASSTSMDEINRDHPVISILVGHSLESDLISLQIIHEVVVDTALIYPHRMGLPFKRALKTLSAEFLKKIIQDDVSGHDSFEDALTCLELMKWKVLRDNPKCLTIN